MTIINCPKCGSINITTAGTCTNCGWSQFAQVTVSSGVYKTIGELEIKMSGKALLDDYKRLLFENNNLTARIAELEAAQRWIPVSEPPKECEMRVFKDGNAWCFVPPDFQDLQVSPSVWAKKGVLDKIYKELRSVRNE